MYREIPFRGPMREKEFRATSQFTWEKILTISEKPFMKGMSMRHTHICHQL